MTIPSETLAVLSTAHVPQEEAERVGPAIEVRQLIGMSREEGWMLLTDKASGDLLVLSDVLNHLRERGFDWVLFDRDAAGTDELPAFDW